MLKTNPSSRALSIKNSPTRKLEMFYRNDKYLNLAAKTFMERMQAFFGT